jgi:Tfp pilus assembly protein PilO
MAGAKTSTWIGGTVFVALVLMAAAYFLAISPTLAAAADVREQTAVAQSENDVLRASVVQLQADFEKLPEYRAELATLQTQVPTEARVADLLRELDAIAVARGVTLTSVNPGAGQAVVLAAPATPAPAVAPVVETEGKQADAPVDPATAAPAAAAVPQGFAALPVSVTVLGTYDNTLAFLADVQTAMPRLFLVSGLSGTAQKDAEASSGRPQTVVGDQELIVTGFAYVLPDRTVVGDDASLESPPLPGAVPGKNPLVPIAGR